MVKGICYLCNHEYTKKGMKKHVKNCNSDIKNAEERMILKVSSVDDENYFLYLAVKKNQTLRQLDVFLRKLWLECCGHLSCFTMGNVSYESSFEDDNMDYYLGGYSVEKKAMFFTIARELGINERMEYEYDYGSTTSLEILRNEDKWINVEIKEPIYVVTRNIAPVRNGIEDPYNSPRTGVCGYEGPLDSVILDPSYEEVDKRTRANLVFLNNNKDLSDNDDFAYYDNDSFSLFDFDGFESRSIYPMNKKISLTDGLKTLGKDELTIIRKAIKVKNVSQLNKAKLIEQLEEVIPNWYTEQLNYCDTNQIKFLKRIANEGWVVSREVENEYFLDMNDIYFIKDFMIFIGYEMTNNAETGTVAKHIAVMPEEIRHIVKDFDESGNNFKLKQHQQWIKLTAGLCHVYGVIDKKACLSFVEMVLNQKIDALTYYNVIQHSLNYYIEVEDDDSNYICVRAFNKDEIINEQEMRATLEHKLFTKTELIGYSDENYFVETIAVGKFMDYLRTWYDMDNDAVDEIMSSITNEFIAGKLPQEVLAEMPEYLDIPDENVLNDITFYLLKIYESTPQWFLKGHAPNEVQNEMKSVTGTMKIPNSVTEDTNVPFMNEVEDHEVKSDVISFSTGKKIESNDACPCGSGKKYKHCCGK